MRNLGPTLLTILILMGGSDAIADDAAAAEEAFQSGKGHLEAGRLEEACADFGRSQKLESSVGTLLNLGECSERLGKTKSAWTFFKRAAKKAGLDKQAARKRFALKRAGKLQPRLTQLLLAAKKAKQGGLRITMDGEDVTDLLGSENPVDPSEYLFEATAPGKERWTKRVRVVGEGRTVRVEVPLLLPKSETSKEEKDKPETSDSLAPTGNDSKVSDTSLSTSSEKPAGGGRRLLVFGLGGSGVAFVATGLVFGSLANSKLSDSEDHCNSDNLCDQTGFDLVAKARTYANVSTVLVGVGGLALVAGTYLWITSPSGEPSADSGTTVRVFPTASDTRVGVALGGAF